MTGAHTGTLLDEALPTWERAEVHEARMRASPERVIEVLRSLPGREIPFFAPLMAIRLLPHVLRGDGIRFDHDVPLVEEGLRHGFVMLGVRPGRELAIGAIGQFWRIAHNDPVRDLDGMEGFRAFDEPGYAKAAMSFVTLPDGEGCRVVTETRIHGTSRDAVRAFGRYWLVIRAGSGLIRRGWLHAIRRRAEAGPREEGS